jgi:hypothetical protein
MAPPDSGTTAQLPALANCSEGSPLCSSVAASTKARPRILFWGGTDLAKQIFLRPKSHFAPRRQDHQVFQSLSIFSATSAISEISEVSDPQIPLKR